MHRRSYLRGGCVQRKGIHRFGVLSHGVHFQIGDRVCEGEFCGWESDRWGDINDRMVGVLAGVPMGKGKGIASTLRF